MKLRIADVWRLDGVLDRRTFVAWGAILTAVKLVLDWLLLAWLGVSGWSVASYFAGPVPGLVLTLLSLGWGAAALGLLVSLPFLWAGCVLCLARLRSAGLPLWWVALFVVPVLKGFLFVVLVLIPPAPAPGQPRGPDPGRGGFGWLPTSRLGSAAAAILASGLLSGGIAVLSTEGLRQYGWGLFVGTPFVQGFMAAVLYGAHRPRKLADTLGVAMLATVLVGLGFLLAAFEGLICLVMAAPLALALSLTGAVLGHAVQASRWRLLPPRLGGLAPGLALPLMLGTDVCRPEPAPLFGVTTTVQVSAAPATVWRHVVEFAELPPPTEALFRLGIAYPVRARIDGRGVGAVRRCEFSTGPFVEPITVWEEARRLAFEVTENPAPLEEWTPYRRVDPPHLDGFLVSQRGQFLLEPTADGGTRLRGTTWYQHHLWPAVYWRVWSDFIIHTIHRRVLNHVKALAEREPPSTAVLDSRPGG